MFSAFERRTCERLRARTRNRNDVCDMQTNDGAEARLCERNTHTINTLAVIVCVSGWRTFEWFQPALTCTHLHPRSTAADRETENFINQFVALAARNRARLRASCVFACGRANLRNSAMLVFYYYYAHSARDTRKRETFSSHRHHHIYSINYALVATY